jgi:hypothetical protein
MTIKMKSAQEKYSPRERKKNMYTIDKAKTAVKDAIKGYLLKDSGGNYVMQERNRLPLYLEGAPGIGKTEIVEQIAQEMGIGYVSFSMVHHTRNSLLGLPVIQELEDGDKYTAYTMSEIIARVLERVEKGEREGILLLDEFPCMSETVMPAMLAFLQTKNIGTHHLPEGWVIVLCGNPPEYNRASRKFSPPILDRIRKIEVNFEPNCFLAYGKETGMEEIILSYLQMHPDHAYRCSEENGKTELVTCRGWENLSHAMKVYGTLEQNVDRDLVGQFIKSGEISDSFLMYYRQWMTGFSRKEMEDILEGRGFEKYREKITKDFTYRQQWMLTEYLCEMLTTQKTKDEAGRGRYREISGWMSNVLDLIKAIDENGVLLEKTFRFINKSDLLVDVVNNVVTPEYLELCDRFIGDVSSMISA